MEILPEGHPYGLMLLSRQKRRRTGGESGTSLCVLGPGDSGRGERVNEREQNREGQRVMNRERQTEREKERERDRNRERERERDRDRKSVV